MRDIVTENQVRRLMGERDLLLSAIAPADYAKIEAQLVAIAESPDTPVPAVPAQEAPREICPACGSSFKSVRQFAYSTDRTARAPCGDKWHEPQAGAQVPSQDYKEMWLKAVDHGLAQHIIKVRENTKLREELGRVNTHLNSIKSYATEAAKTPITREDMHDPLKAQTFFDEAKGFERLVMSEINPKGKS